MGRVPRPEEFAKLPAVLLQDYPALDPLFHEYSTTHRMGMAYKMSFGWLGRALRERIGLMKPLAWHW